MTHAYLFGILPWQMDDLTQSEQKAMDRAVADFNKRGKKRGT